MESQGSGGQAVPVLRGTAERESETGEGGAAEPGAADRAAGWVCVYEAGKRGTVIVPMALGTWIWRL